MMCKEVIISHVVTQFLLSQNTVLNFIQIKLLFLFYLHKESSLILCANNKMYISLFVESLNHGKQNCAWVYTVTLPQSLYFTSDTYSQGFKKKKKSKPLSIYQLFIES